MKNKIFLSYIISQMKDFTDIEEFDRAVDSIPLMGFTTRIDKALRMAQKDLFALKYGARPSTPKILIVLTDGSQSWEFDFEDPGTHFFFYK